MRPSTNPMPRGRSRKSKRSFRPLDLSDLDAALPTQTPPHTRQSSQNAPLRRQTLTNNLVTRSNPPTTLQRPQQPTPKRTQPNKHQAPVPPHPGWSSLSSQMAQPVQPGWSNVEFNQSNLDKLLLLCHTKKELRSEGYVLKQLTQKELFSKMRCITCHIRRKGQVLKSDKSASRKPVMAKSMSQLKQDNPILKEARYTKEQDEEHSEPTLPPPPPAVCFWHPGRILHDGSSLVWFCCKQKLAARGCESNTAHRWEDENHPDTHLPWRFYQTELEYPNTLMANTDPRPAVALDCEMGLSENNESELIRLTAVDFFTGVTLIDQLVVPDVKIKSWNTRYSGVTANQINKAKRSGQCFFGRDAAGKPCFNLLGQRPS